MPRHYGLIGQKLGHSFSKDFFTKKFQEKGSDESYSLFEISSLEQLIPLVEKHSYLEGLNVTIPYKVNVIPFLNELSDEAQKIGAVNTIRIERKDKVWLKGYNTDAFGFERSIKPFLDMHHQRAIILGNGGASKAVQFVLHKLGIDFIIVTSKPNITNQISWSQFNAAMLNSVYFLINTTPVGMYPDTEVEMPIPYSSIGSKHLIVDLIYNPQETILLQKAKANKAIAMNGLNMLYLQAEKAYEIWNTNE